MPDAVMAVVLAYGNTDATEDVAKYRAAVGVEEETSCPELSRVSSMFVAIPESVIVPVAVTPATERFPEIKVFPCTENLLAGVAVAIPIPVPVPKIVVVPAPLPSKKFPKIVANPKSAPTALTPPANVLVPVSVKSVEPLMVSVPVAEMFATVRLPEISAFP